ncbi:MAG: hypothetical protein A2Z69_02355 [Bacteroidetes bacterium RBG_13_44_24]|nr:MAG: hypothetical protein A2Z69_02355 [Bacteroidetes bacterium RBG_13_44_24]
MTIKQEQFMQLFGRWGYNNHFQIENEINAIHKLAKNCGDKVGVITCEQLLASCYYAETGDAIHSVTKRLPIKDGASDIKDNGISFDVIKDMINKTGAVTQEYLELSLEDYCNGVLESAYDITCKYTDFESAVIYLRQYIFSTLSVVALSGINTAASLIGESVLRTMVTMALAEYEKSSGASTEYTINKACVNSFNKITKYMLKNKERIMEIPSLIHPDFKELTRTIVYHLYDDMSINFQVINASIMDSFTMMPHEIFEYSMGFSNIVEAILIGVSAGILDYKDYESIVPKEIEIKGILDTKIINDIERLRSN